MFGVNYTVEIGWARSTTGMFTIGVSTLGGADTLPGSFGGYAWTDATGDVREVTITRGRDAPLGATAPGRCTLTLFDKTGKYAPTNTASPLYANLKPRRPLRVRATVGGVTYGLFYGFVETIQSDPDYGRQEAVIEATDLAAWLDAIPVAFASGPTTTGAAIGTVLNQAGWTDPTLRVLGVGDALPGVAVDGSTSALATIAALLETERGRFYVRGDGAAVYEDRAAPNRAPRTAAQATLAAELRAVAPRLDIRSVKNRARVTRTGGVEQVALDDASSFAYGPRDHGAITSPYLASDNQALGLARWLVAQEKDPQPSARYLDLTTLVPSAQVPILARDLGDRVNVTNAPTGMTGDYHIERIEHRIVANVHHDTTWVLSPRAAAQPFLIGVSLLGGADLLTF